MGRNRGGNLDFLTEKEQAALDYWVMRKNKEGRLFNHHFDHFYTDHFDLHRGFYRDKCVLDIGCGARGSLEWADDALQRVGLDPLAKHYLSLDGHEHKMQYVAAYAESIPFDDGCFDVVCSFNSLDHVDSFEDSLMEIIRVLKRRGLLLILTEVNIPPRLREPQLFGWRLVDRFLPYFTIMDEKHYGKTTGIYESIEAGEPYDHATADDKPGVLSLKLRKL